MMLDVLIALFSGGLLVSFLIFYLRRLNDKKSECENDSKIEEIVTLTSSEVKDKKYVKEKKKPVKQDLKFQFTHSWLVTILKGHTTNVLDFDISSNGRYIISVSSDRGLFMWKVKDIWQKDRKIIRSAVVYDTATKIKFSPDDKACVMSLEMGNTIRIVKIKKEEKNYTFPTCVDFPKGSSSDLINIGIASTGNYIMSCYNNTTMIVWSLKGDILSTIDTGNMYNYFGIISPCARFISASGFSSDARVWSVEFDKAKAFKQVTRAFELKGHTSAILSICFTADSTKLATISKDGTWRLWNINVDFKHQDPIFIKSGKYPYKNDGGKLHISLSTAGQCLTIAQNKTIYFVDTETAEIIETLENAHSDPISSLNYETKNKLFMSSGGKYINVYNDIVSRKVDLRHQKEKLRRSADDKAQKQYLSEQIKEAEKCINALLTVK